MSSQHPLSRGITNAFFRNRHLQADVVDFSVWTFKGRELKIRYFLIILASMMGGICNAQVLSTDYGLGLLRIRDLAFVCPVNSFDLNNLKSPQRKMKTIFMIQSSFSHGCHKQYIQFFCPFFINSSKFQVHTQTCGRIAYESTFMQRKSSNLIVFRKPG